MKIKEVEELLSVSRSNIRFYEREGLLRPKREGNNYRDYSDEDVECLRKILVLRKLGFSVEEILAMQKGELSLPDAALENIKRLEEEIEALKGAIEITREISKENTSYDEMDGEKLWEDIHRREGAGQKFKDILRDFLSMELQAFDIMWKAVFFHDFKKDRKKYGVPLALGILLVACILRGIGRVVFWDGTFWEGFSYPFMLFAFVSLFFLPLFIIRIFSPKAAGVIVAILGWIAITFLALLALLIIVSLITYPFR